MIESIIQTESFPKNFCMFDLIVDRLIQRHHQYHFN